MDCRSHNKYIHLKLFARCSSIASPICQEGQSSRTFLNFAFSSWFFLCTDFFPPSDFFPLSHFLANFSLLRGPFCPPLPPYWLHHWLDVLIQFPLTGYLGLIKCSTAVVTASRSTFEGTLQLLHAWQRLLQ